jgi:hypothetical protein
MLFFYLITLFCLSNSLPVEKMIPKMRLSNDSIVEEDFATDTKNATGIFDDRDFLTEIKTNPKKFIAEVQNLDPDSVAEIIALLQALRETSTTRETELIDDMNNKKNALDTANQALIDAEDALDRANVDLANAETTQVQAAETAAAAKVDHTAKTDAHATAKEIHDQEIPSLDDEQQVLTDVIDMMSGLHKRYAGVYTVGTCIPKNSYTENECCAPGYKTVETSADCREAFDTLAIAGANIGGDSQWPSRPSGCFWHQPNKYFHFNTLTTDQITNTLTGNDKVICKNAEKYTVGTCLPTGQYEDRQCCAYGYTEITTSADCREAFNTLAIAGANIGGDSQWPSRPSGCFWHQPNKYFHFNTLTPDQITNTLTGNDKVICTLI